ncbi:MAG TPA: bifunctional adenosylcobinamide kinase/adenosylcobinamide-phosphate guanylyltransferase [Candidatus Cryosericum sp.]|nr:bifunctional adenosylcobinamide kinase/adenosylcobinamide-phosphate guanylyltransferase [Candidatus Cryosericum sp.]
MILVTGGEKSGKSTYALNAALERGSRRAFVATAEPFDEEMDARIRRHKAERGAAFETVEEPVEVPAVLRRCTGYDVVLVDCMTTWVGNLMHYERDVEAMQEELLASISGNEVIVTNEVGMGVIPLGESTRLYVERLGRLNAALARRAAHVVFMVSGIPMVVK